MQCVFLKLQYNKVRNKQQEKLQKLYKYIIPGNTASTFSEPERATETKKQNTHTTKTRPDISTQNYNLPKLSCPCENTIS